MTQPVTPPVTDPTPPPAPPTPPADPIAAFNATIAQFESDLAAYQALAVTAATSAAKATADKIAADSAKSVAHTDFMNVSLQGLALDPGAPGMTQAAAAMRKFASIRHQ